MATATMTTKGQITIPAAVRASLGLDTGSRIEFVEIEKGKYAIVPATGSVLALKGILRRTGRPVSIARMNEVIAMRGAGKKLKSGSR